jgi:hypothetical protein
MVLKSLKLQTTNTGISVTGDGDFTGNVTVGTGIINASIGGDIAITQGAIGIRINDAASAISPSTAGGNNDNAVDLGVANIRFKDLYLGGSITAGATTLTSSDENVLKLVNSAGQPSLIRFNDTSTTTDPFVGSYGNDLAFGTYGGSEAMRISSGNVGIGTDSPNVKLQIINSDSTQNILSLSNQNDSTLAFDFGRVVSTGALSIQGRQTGYNNILLAPTSGNVGIGTDSPGEKLSVIGADNTNQARIGHSTQSVFIKVNGTNVDYNSSGNSVGSHTFSTGNTERMRIRETGAIEFTGASTTTNAQAYFVNNNTEFQMGSSVSSGVGKPMTFHTAGAEKMRLTSTGDLLIGTTGVPDGTSHYGSGFIPVSTDKVQLRMASSDTAAGTLMTFSNPNGTVGNITISGTTTAYNTSSDYRLKEDLQDFKGLDLVSKIPVYDYKWKSDKSRSYGVMAHELEEVLPQAVSGEKDAEEMQSVDYSKIVPLLVKCQCEKK